MENNNAGKGNQTVHELNTMVDNVPYFVEAVPFQFNDQVRYNIMINGGPTDVFVWDEDVQLFKALNEDASTLPDGLIRAITTRILELQQ